MQQILPVSLYEKQNMPPAVQPIIAPATVNWGAQARRDPAMEELTERMSRMTAHISDLQRQINSPRPVQRFMANPTTPATGSNAYPIRCFRCNQEGHTLRDCSMPDTRICKRCGEKGHSAARCMTETSRIASRPTQINVVTFEEEDFDSDDEYYANLEAFPVVENKRKPGRPKKDGSPYTTKTPRTVQRAVAKERESDGEERDELFEEEVNRIIHEETPIEDTPMIESVKEKKLRKTKKYGLDVWKEMENMTIPVKIGQLTEIPTFRQQIRKGLGESGPAYEITEINTTQETDNDNEPKNSSAYSQCQIEEIMMPCIIDTGAGGCIISKVILE